MKKVLKYPDYNGLLGSTREEKCHKTAMFVSENKNGTEKWHRTKTQKQSRDVIG